MRPAAPCQRCGRLIEHPRGPQRYCTDCRIALDRERRAAYAAAHRGDKPKPKEPQPLGSRSGKRGYIRICVVCGKVMRGVGNKTKYCPECRRLHQNARARELARIKRDRSKHPASGDVRAVAAEADAAGLSYGQYVARKESKP